jgi:hypothetical protein
LFKDDLCSHQLILLLEKENKDTIVNSPPFMKVHMKGNLVIVGKSAQSFWLDITAINLS